ncbi:hypothetical protein [Sphingomonas sp. BAUL-RG-20F-R05-02]|uniref:hypothetical protein n=1 Tax=Sphingomonas sp. BAUL-RG-20F-R05-02 TaxID=2914830 RepID=UPI001F56CEF5|nr:hypothetical protein [Sphingomonas sp. BAUL-RG-20F-R05-02]
MDDAPELLASDDNRTRIMELVNAIQLLTFEHFPDPVENLSFGMAAGMIFAGSQYGNSVAAGMESGQRNRTRAVLKMMERNFKSGIDLALKRATRVMRETGRQQ